MTTICTWSDSETGLYRLNAEVTINIYKGPTRNNSPTEKLNKSNLVLHASARLGGWMLCPQAVSLLRPGRQRKYTSSTPYGRHIRDRYMEIFGIAYVKGVSNFVWSYFFFLGGGGGKGGEMRHAP